MPHHQVLWKNSDNSITLSKRSSTDYIQPLADAIQNYQIISNGTGVNSTTNAPYVTFSRPMSLTSANSNGNGIYANLSSPSQSLIWATSTTPPSSSLLNATLAQHGTSGRAVAGVFTLYNTSNSNNNTGGGAMGGRVSFSGASMTTLLSLVAVGVSLFL